MTACPKTTAPLASFLAFSAWRQVGCWRCGSSLRAFGVKSKRKRSERIALRFCRRCVLLSCLRGARRSAWFPRGALLGFPESWGGGLQSLCRLLFCPWGLFVQAGEPDFRQTVVSVSALTRRPGSVVFHVFLLGVWGWCDRGHVKHPDVLELFF